MDTVQAEISQSEWEVMRVIWTLGSATTHDLTAILEEKMGWKSATTKTFLGRLVKKQALSTEKEGREFRYRALIPEQAAMDEATQALFDHLCAMKAGQTLENLINALTLSQHDIAQLQAVLAQKAKTAPEKVDCNCLPDDCQC